MIATINVSTTLYIEAKRKSLELIIVMNSVPVGNSSFIFSNSAAIRSFTSVALEPATW